jgi:uncharacterized membrane protein YfcA
MVVQIVLCVLVGAFSGIAAALCGIGGGVVMVPAFTALIGIGQKEAAATSLAAIILTSVAATVKNSGNNLINWRVLVPTALAAAVFAWFAADHLHSLSNELLARVFGGLIVVVGLKMLIMGN